MRDHLIGVVVNNGRWEFHWDVPSRLVAAWSTSLIGKRSVFEARAWFTTAKPCAWAEQHRAEIHKKSATLDGGRRERRPCAGRGQAEWKVIPRLTPSGSTRRPCDRSGISPEQWDRQAIDSESITPRRETCPMTCWLPPAP